MFSFFNKNFIYQLIIILVAIIILIGIGFFIGKKLTIKESISSKEVLNTHTTQEKEEFKKEQNITNVHVSTQKQELTNKDIQTIVSAVIKTVTQNKIEKAEKVQIGKRTISYEDGNIKTVVEENISGNTNLIDNSIKTEDSQINTNISDKSTSETIVNTIENTNTTKETTTSLVEKNTTLETKTSEVIQIIEKPVELNKNFSNSKFGIAIGANGKPMITYDIINILDISLSGEVQVDTQEGNVNALGVMFSKNIIKDRYFMGIYNQYNFNKDKPEFGVAFGMRF